MLYKEFIEKYPEKAAKITKVSSLGGGLLETSGRADTDKIMNMSIMMVSEAEDHIEMTLC